MLIRAPTLVETLIDSDQVRPNTICLTSRVKHGIRLTIDPPLKGTGSEAFS